MNSRWLNYFLLLFVPLFLVPAVLQGADTAAVDAQGIRHRSPEYSTRENIPWLVDRLKCPAPRYPFWDVETHHEGTGLFKIGLDLKTGTVTNVTMLQSTGFGGLDKAAITALKQWTWKPGKWKEIEMPVTFTLTQDSSQPGLRAYVNTRGPVISKTKITPQPELVKDRQGHYLTGTGLMRLYMSKSRQVKSIEVLKSTGHPELDAAAQRAFIQWQIGSGEISDIKVPFQFTDRPSVEVGYGKVSPPKKNSKR